MAKPEDGLEHLVHEGIIDAVRARLMSGKEATVFVVERAGHLGAAKVYRARDDRTFKKVASYVEGRNQTRNSRDRRAMENKSRYGRGLLEEGWQEMEFRALRAAFDAGVRVPEPYFLFENVLFMELVVDAAGAPAPRLADVSFSPDEASQLHLEIFLQIAGLLDCGQIHGDLSAYNILMGARGPTIIDLPQVVDASANNNAAQILRRDLRNVTEHLARFDARLLRFADCGAALFQHYARGTMATVTGPEESAPQSRRGGRRGRDAERGRAGRDKAPRVPQGAPPREAQVQPPHGAHGAPPRERQSQPPHGAPPRERQSQPPHGAPPRERQSQPPHGPHGQGRNGAQGQAPRDQRQHGTSGQSPHASHGQRRDEAQSQPPRGPRASTPPREGGTGARPARGEAAREAPRPGHRGPSLGAPHPDRRGADQGPPRPDHRASAPSAPRPDHRASAPSAPRPDHRASAPAAPHPDHRAPPPRPDRSGERPPRRPDPRPATTAETSPPPAPRDRPPRR